MCVCDRPLFYFFFCTVAFDTLTRLLLFFSSSKWNTTNCFWIWNIIVIRFHLDSWDFTEKKNENKKSHALALYILDSGREPTLYFYYVTCFFLCVCLSADGINVFRCSCLSVFFFVCDTEQRFRLKIWLPFWEDFVYVVLYCDKSVDRYSVLFIVWTSLVSFFLSSYTMAFFYHFLCLSNVFFSFLIQAQVIWNYYYLPDWCFPYIFCMTLVLYSFCRVHKHNFFSASS